MAPDEEILIIECTVRVLDPKDKLSKLIHRVEHAKTELRDSFSTMHVRGVLVTPLPPDKVEQLRRLTSDNNIVLMCRTDLAECFERTRRICQPKETLARWQQHA